MEISTDELLAGEARAGKLFGVWNTDDSNGLRLIHRHGRTWLKGERSWPRALATSNARW